MGRAIGMENDIDLLKVKVDKIEGALQRVIESVDRLENKSSTTKHIDLVEDVKPKEVEQEQSVDIKDVEEACEDALDKLAEKDETKTVTPKKNAKSNKNKK